MCEAVSGNLPGIRDKYHALLSKQTVNRESIVWKDQQVRMRLFCTMQHQVPVFTLPRLKSTELPGLDF
ncbi:hypothetical protein Y1Q_0009978 [Alligator mississippiensis]|uniref:Uncharacterized protein n=1 Tax=Alligator mississippiensis TaxID=8496 RepID=A0A151P4F0_ALLMI|nr:hypothetical protein Y1Q_0009978 [Alligator mississippiensis]